MILSNPIITGTGFSVFSNPGTLNVPAGGTTTFVIRFDPTGAGVINGTVSLTNNDSNENPYNFNILGTGFNPAPEIDLQGGFPLISLVSGDNTPTSAKGSAFGTQNIAYGNVVRTFYVYNLGTLNLTITSIASSNPLIFAVSTISATPILPNTFSTFTVTFIPTAATLNPNTFITINNNDSNEGAYILRVSGTGNTTAASDFNIRGGLPLTTININDPASTAKGTDFGDQYIFSGTKTSTFTINNVMTANSLSIGAMTFTGGNANTDFTVTAAPATSVAANASTTFTVSYNPTASGIRNTVMSIVNNDPNESPYYFYLSGTGNAYTDSDRDGVTDNIDIDDDNDGILDTLEQSECKLSPTSGSVERVFLLEDFGAGTNSVAINNTNPGAKTDYAFVNVPTVSPTDGKYTVYYKIGGLVSDANKISSWGSYAWTDIGDNGDHTTGDINGRMAVFNADYVPDGVFYELAVDGITPNIPITFDFWVMNIDRSNQSFINNGNSGEQPRLLPNLKLEIVDALGTALYSDITGAIARCLDGSINGCGDVISQWTLKSFADIDLGLVTSFKIRISNIGPGGFGNDLAIDDLKLTQRYCDYDLNNDPDVIDLDADNDGIPDIVEAGLGSFSFSGASSTTTKSQMIRPDAKWTDTNPVNGMNDAVDILIANNTYLTTYVKDSDGDGIRDYLDFDSDNDSVFDIDENTVDNFMSANNGDGDIDGDGKGDGLELDKDGIQDLNDDLNGYGTTAKLLPVDSDGDGIPNFIDIQSFGNAGAFDIGNTNYGQLGLYRNLDLNGDGKIDGTTDSDRDGINDALDIAAAGFGSPRNLTNLKLLIDFDGRNDYGEGPNLLNNF